MDFSNTRAPKGFSKKEYKTKRIALAKEIAELQQRLFANNDKNLLVVVQGMDSSGKDGVSRKTFSYCSPNGVSAHSFKKPSDEEFAHDFLWRCHKVAPRKGHIQIFIRSHYEDVLIQRVHKWIDEKRVRARFDAINAWEKLLIEDNNTIVLKFFLNLSFEKQGEKLQERIDIPEKNYKHNPGDWEERKHWDSYMKCYQDVIKYCSEAAPWIMIPADQRWYRDYMVAKHVHQTLTDLNLTYPTIKEDV